MVILKSLKLKEKQKKYLEKTARELNTTVDAILRKLIDREMKLRKVK